METPLIDQIKTLSELDFSALLREMAEHLRREKWEHMIDDCFDIETYEDELEEAKEELRSMKQKYLHADGILNEIRDLL